MNYVFYAICPGHVFIGGDEKCSVRTIPDRNRKKKFRQKGMVTLDDHNYWFKASECPIQQTQMVLHPHITHLQTDGSQLARLSKGGSCGRPKTPSCAMLHLAVL